MNNIKNKDKREKYITRQGYIGYDAEDINDESYGWSPNEDYLAIFFKWGDCKKGFNYSKKFAKLEPQFIKDYEKYWKDTTKYEGCGTDAIFNPPNIKTKVKMFRKIIAMKKKYKEKVRLILDMHIMEVDINNLKKWFRNNNGNKLI